MTDLKKPVTRRTRAPLGSQGRRLVVSLLPGDVLEIREERRRVGARAPLDWVFWAMTKRNVDAGAGWTPRERSV